MSELYEGVVIVGDIDTVSSRFDSLDSTRTLRLVRFDDWTFGAYPVALRADLIDDAHTDAIARHLSGSCGNALAVLYDDRTGLRASKLFRDGKLVREFGELDEQWVRLGEDGYPDANGTVLSADELDPDDEYECIQDAISLGLADLGVASSVTSSDLKQTFCYNEGEVVAEMEAK